MNRTNEKDEYENLAEPCTVPQLLRLTAFSSETATFSWRAPRKNNGPESYVIQFSQEPAPPFHFWQRYKCGSSKTYTITGLMPNTRYFIIVIFLTHSENKQLQKHKIIIFIKKYFSDQNTGKVSCHKPNVIEE